MLYILENIHSSRGSGCCYLVVEADNEKKLNKWQMNLLPMMNEPLIYRYLKLNDKCN